MNIDDYEIALYQPRGKVRPKLSTMKAEPRHAYLAIVIINAEVTYPEPFVSHKFTLATARKKAGGSIGRADYAELEQLLMDLVWARLGSEYAD